MINEKIYPKEDGDIQYGVRRIPLHYISKDEGGNGILQYGLLELCQLTVVYHNSKNDFNEQEKTLFKLVFEKDKIRFKNKQEQIYQNLLNVVNNSESNHKEQIKNELINYHFDLVDLIESIEL